MRPKQRSARFGTRWKRFAHTAPGGEGRRKARGRRTPALAGPGAPAAVYWVLADAAAVLFLASLLGHDLSHVLVTGATGSHARDYPVDARRDTELGSEPPDAAGGRVRESLPARAEPR